MLVVSRALRTLLVDTSLGQRAAYDAELCAWSFSKNVIVVLGGGVAQEADVEMQSVWSRHPRDPHQAPEGTSSSETIFSAKTVTARFFGGVAGVLPRYSPLPRRAPLLPILHGIDCSCKIKILHEISLDRANIITLISGRPVPAAD